MKNTIICFVLSLAVAAGIVTTVRYASAQSASETSATDTSEHPYRPLIAQAPAAGSAVTIPPFEPATDTSTAAPQAAEAKPATATPAVPDPEVDTAGFFKSLLDAATTGKWKVLAGLVLVGLVAAARRWVFGKVKWFQTKLGGITLALGLSLAGTFGLALASGAAITVAVAMNALSTAVAAAGLWQWLQHATAPKAE